MLFIVINCYGWWKWRRDELFDVTGEQPKMNAVNRARREGYQEGFNDGRKAERRFKSGW